MYLDSKERRQAVVKLFSIQNSVTRVSVLGVAVAAVFGLLAPAVCAASGAIAQSYQTSSTNISKGVLVSLVAAGSNKVEPASRATNAGRLVGVAADQPLVELSTDDGKTTQIVVGGSTLALVSDINGTVKAGDKIAASMIGGVGMKATASGEVVGTAQADLSGGKTVSKSITDNSGKQHQTKIGLLPVAINVTYYTPVDSGERLAAFVPSALQSLADNIAGRHVSALRVMLSGSFLIFSFITIIIMLQTAIRGGIISLGRNPLAKKALRRGLLDILIAAIAVLVVSSAVAFAFIIV